MSLVSKSNLGIPNQGVSDYHAGWKEGQHDGQTYSLICASGVAAVVTGGLFRANRRAKQFGWASALRSTGAAVADTPAAGRRAKSALQAEGDFGAAIASAIAAIKDGASPARAGADFAGRRLRWTTG